MDTKKIVIIIVILVLVFILVNSLITKKEKENNVNNQPINYNAPPSTKLTCDEKCNKDTNCLEACYYVDINKAVVSGDINLCDKVSISVKQICIDKVNMKKALQANDKNLCNQIVNQDVKTDCLSSIS